MHRKASPCDINRVSHINSGMGSLSFVTCAGMLNDLADERGMVKGHLWLVWDTNGAARLVMGPPPQRGAASEQFSFGAHMAGSTLSHHFQLLSLNAGFSYLLSQVVNMPALARYALNCSAVMGWSSLKHVKVRCKHDSSKP